MYLLHFVITMLRKEKHSNFVRPFTTQTLSSSLSDEDKKVWENEHSLPYYAIMEPMITTVSSINFGQFSSGFSKQNRNSSFCALYSESS